ncbi:ATP-binding protein [Thiotrichales bacterium 19X7-9]|nr:ATP-binding protein [Thiotrichales bacterium 19X7-9]
MQQIKAKLKEYKLSGMYQSLEDRLRYAKSESLAHIEFLELLLEDEHNNRKDNSYKKRYAKAKLPAHKTIEEFDFTFQPSIDKKLINDCLTCQFIKEKKNIVFIGSPGTGKTHLSTAIALSALAKGYKALFTCVIHKDRFNSLSFISM